MIIECLFGGFAVPITALLSVNTKRLEVPNED